MHLLADLDVVVRVDVAVNEPGLAAGGLDDVGRAVAGAPAEDGLAAAGDQRLVDRHCRCAQEQVRLGDKGQEEIPDHQEDALRLLPPDPCRDKATADQAEDVPIGVGVEDLNVCVIRVPAGHPYPAGHEPPRPRSPPATNAVSGQP